ncbi:MAG: hypothetical protein IJE40_00810, partial [Clostridia bacterium]|nr:hypothetical protein [Clostridia bacterium]
MYIRKLTGASREEAEEILKDTGSECLDSGIRNVEDIVAVDEMKREIIAEQEALIKRERKVLNEEEKLAMEERALRHTIAIQKLSDRLPSNINKLGAKKIEGHRLQFKSELKEKLKEKSFS